MRRQQSIFQPSPLEHEPDRIYDEALNLPRPDQRLKYSSDGGNIIVEQEGACEYLGPDILASMAEETIKTSLR